MIIGVDGNEANVENRVGVSVYTYNLLKYFASHATDKTRFVVYLRHAPATDMPEENEFYTYQHVKGVAAWSQIFLPLHLYTHRKPDVFFAPAHYIPRMCPIPVVVTIHDLAYYYYPDEFLKKDLYKLRHWTAYAISKARKIIAVSKTTKKDIIRHFNLADEMVDVIYNGYEKEVREDMRVSLADIDSTIEPDLYFLYVGTLQPRKNILTLMHAFKAFSTKHPEYKLVIAGKKGWMYQDVFELRSDLDLRDQVIFTGFIPDSSVTTLYKHAKAFIMPSRYEGFGIPVLEAMSHGCPVISSTSSSLPEIGGDACLYFDPDNTNELAEKMGMIVTDSDLRASLIAEGKKRIMNFSWDTCATETLRTLQQSIL